MQLLNKSNKMECKNAACKIQQVANKFENYRVDIGCLPEIREEPVKYQ